MKDPRFQLNDAIAQWRRDLCSRGIETRALDELESHLREEIERQTSSGTAISRAFEISVLKIGSATTLEAEFGKLKAARLARAEKCLRVYSVVFPVVYLYLGSRGLFRVEMSFAERTMGFLAIVLTSLFVLATPHYHRFLPPIPNKLRRERIQLACTLGWIVAGGLFANLALPHLNLSVSQVIVVFLWLVTPCALLAGVGVGLGIAAQRKTATPVC